VAGLAAIVASSAVPGSVDSYHRVYAAAMLVSLLCALGVAGLLVVVRPRPAVPRAAAAAPPDAALGSPSPSPQASRD